MKIAQKLLSLLLAIAILAGVTAIRVEATSDLVFPVDSTEPIAEGDLDSPATQEPIAVEPGLRTFSQVLAADLLAQLPRLDPTQTVNVIATYDSAPTDADLDYLRSLGVRGGMRFQALPMIAFAGTRAQIEALAASPGIRSIYPNTQLKLYLEQAGEFIGAREAARDFRGLLNGLPVTGAGVTIAVLDSGIDATHPDLTLFNKVKQNVKLVFDEREVFGEPRGFIAPVWLENQPNTDENVGHGTHVAGIAAGTGAKSSGRYAGIAPGADLVGLGAGAAVFVLNILEGMDYILTHPNLQIRVVNNSWGSTGEFDPNNPINVATLALYDAGVTVVFSAGNEGPGEGTLNPYSAAPWVISVAAGDSRGVLTNFSSRGKYDGAYAFTTPDGRRWTTSYAPTVVAPGSRVISTRASTGLVMTVTGATRGDTNIPPSLLPYYTTNSGTSMSSPMVAGVAALILQANPFLTPAQVKQVIEQTATPMRQYFDFEVGAGYVNAYAAVQQALALARGSGLGYGSYRNGLGNDFPVLADSASFSGQMDVSAFGFSQADHPFQVSESQFLSLARLEWDDPVYDETGELVGVSGNDLDLYLVDPRGRVVGRGDNLQAYFVWPKETAYFGYGTPGRYTAQVQGTVSAPTNYRGSVDNYYLDLSRLSDWNSFSNPDYQQAAVEAVGKKLIKVYGNKFKPTRALSRGELARALALGGKVRQWLPDSPTYADVAANTEFYPYVEAVTRAGLMTGSNGRFRPKDAVSKVDFAYVLLNGMGLAAEAQALEGADQFTYYYYEGGVEKSAQVPVSWIKDWDQVPPGRRGYVILGLNRKIIRVGRLASYEVVPIPTYPFYELRLNFYLDSESGVSRQQAALAFGQYVRQIHPAPIE